MSTPWRLLAVPALAVALVTSCGGDDSDSAEATTTAVPSTTAPVSTTAAPSTSPAPTTLPDTTTTVAASTIPDTPVTGDVLEIIVKVGEDSSPDRVEPVPLGSEVLLRVLADEAQVIHVHGYDLELEVPAGGEAAFEFTADKPGSFEVESHESGDVLLVLEVS